MIICKKCGHEGQYEGQLCPVCQTRYTLTQNEVRILLEETHAARARREMETVTEKDPESGKEESYEVPKNEPGAISLSDGENLESQTLFPAASVDKLESAAVFFNIRNQNHGTFAAFEVKNESDVQALADMMKNKIKDTQWLCGFPDRYQIMRVGDIIVFSYGLENLMSAWKSAVSSVYEDVAVLYDEMI